MKNNNIKENFTLETVLMIASRHLVFSVLIFISFYWILSTQNFIDNRYEISKTVTEGTYNEDYPMLMVDFRKMSGIIQSTKMSEHLFSTVKDIGDTDYGIIEDEIKNIIITVKGKEAPIIAEVASELMVKLQEFDNESIKRQFKIIDDRIRLDKKNTDIAVNLVPQYTLSDDDISEFVALQKSYDMQYPNSDSSQSPDVISTINDIKERRLKRAMDLETQVLTHAQLVENLQDIKAFDFKPVNYLYPVTIKDVKKYFPNPYFYIVFSLLITLLYNLVVLNYKFRKSSV